MCFCGCGFENYEGDCRRPYGIPCPYDDKACEAFDMEMSAREDRAMEEEMEERLCPNLYR